MLDRITTVPWLICLASAMTAGCGTKDGSSDHSSAAGNGGALATGGAPQVGGSATGGDDATGGVGGTAGDGGVGTSSTGGAAHAGAGGATTTGGRSASGGQANGGDGGSGGEPAATGGVSTDTGGTVATSAGASGTPTSDAGAAGSSGSSTSGAGASGAPSSSSGGASSGGGAGAPSGGGGGASSGGGGGAPTVDGGAGATAGGAGGAWCAETPPTASSAPIPTPALYWSFDDADLVGTTITDASGQGHDGTIVGGVTTGLPGRVGEAVHFTPSLQGITSPASDLKTSPISVCTWVRIDATPAGKQMIVNLGNGAAAWTGTGFQLEPTGEVTFFVEGPGTANDEEAVRTCTPEGRWVHYCSVFDGTQLLLYRGGSLASVEPADFTAVSFGSRPLVLGYHSYFRNRSFEGDLDELAIWSQALTADEVAAVFLQGASGARLDE